MRYRFTGRPAKLTLGTVNDGASVYSRDEKPPLGGFLTLAEARSICTDQQRLLQQGVDPAPAKVEAAAVQKQYLTDSAKFMVENVIGQFFKRHVDAKQLRSAEQIKWVFAKHVTPRWKGKDVRTITKRDVLDLIERINDAGTPVMANRVLAHVRKFFAWAEGTDRIEKNPAAAVAKPGKETSRARVLNDEEIRALWAAAGELGHPFGTLFKYLLLTAQRRDEAAQMTFTEIVDGIWRVPATRAKNGRENTVPLPHQAIELLEGLPKIGKAQIVFTTAGETPVSGFSKSKAQLDAKMAEILGSSVDHFVIHDLRRTAATRLASLGTPVHVTEAVLNHRSGTISGVAAVYNRFDFLEEKKRALQAWADKIDVIVAGKQSPSNVVGLRGAKK